MKLKKFIRSQGGNDCQDAVSANTVMDFQLTSHPHRLLLFNAFESKVVRTHTWGWHALECLIFFIVLVPINLKRLWFRSSTINSGGAYGQLSLIAARWQCNRLCLPLLRKGWRLEALQGKDHFFFVHLSHMGSITQVQAIHTAAYLAKFPSWLLKRNISDVSGLGCVIQYCGT